MEEAETPLYPLSNNNMVVHRQHRTLVTLPIIKLKSDQEIIIKEPQKPLRKQFFKMDMFESYIKKETEDV